MTTASDFLNQASRLAGSRSDGGTLSGEKTTIYLGLLNQYLQNLQSEGVKYNLSTLASADTVYIPQEDELAIRYNLAVLIAEDTGLPIDTRIIIRAKELENSLFDRYLSDEELDLPAPISGGQLFNIETD